MELKTINQTGIKNLIAERIKNPEQYVNKPLIIWRSDFEDGIQERILEEAFGEYNANKSNDERKWYKKVEIFSGMPLSFTDNKIGLSTPLVNSFTDNTILLDNGSYKFGLLAISPALLSYKDMELLYSVINERTCKNVEILPGVPVVAFMCKEKKEVFETPEKYPSAEQYVFKPDFEEWAECLIQKYFEEYRTLPQSVVDFIRGEGDEAGIIYRWYNMFNDSSVGCHNPYRWELVLYNIEEIMDEKELHKIGDLNDNDIESCIDGIAGISPDIKEEFKQYVKSHNL